MIKVAYWNARPVLRRYRYWYTETHRCCSTVFNLAHTWSNTNKNNNNKNNTATNKSNNNCNRNSIVVTRFVCVNFTRVVCTALHDKKNWFTIYTCFESVWWVLIYQYLFYIYGFYCWNLVCSLQTYIFVDLLRFFPIWMNSVCVCVLHIVRSLPWIDYFTKCAFRYNIFAIKMHWRCQSFVQCQ